MQTGTERFFELWAGLIINCSVLVFFLAILMLVLIINGSQGGSRFPTAEEAYYANTFDENFDESLA